MNEESTQFDPMELMDLRRAVGLALALTEITNGDSYTRDVYRSLLRKIDRLREGSSEGGTR